MYRDIVEWRGQNPPPATMMIISNPVRGDLSWDLARLQQRSQYNLFVAYPKSLCYISPLLISAVWVWGKLLGFRDNNRIIETRSAPLAMLCCKSCNFDCQIPEKLRKHLSSYKHARQVSILSLSLYIYCTCISIHCLTYLRACPLLGVCIPYVRRNHPGNGALGKELPGNAWICDS